MTKFRLAVLNTQPPHLYFGGVERRILEVTKRIQKDAEVTVYSGKKAGFITPINIEGINIVPCKSTDKLFPLDNWTYNRSLIKNTKVYDADVIEIHNNSAYGLPKALEKTGKNKPFIHLVHGPLADEYEQGLQNKHQTIRAKLANKFMKYQAKQEEDMAKKATQIVAVSNYSKGKILTHYNLDKNKIQVIPNGVDIQKFKPKNITEARKQLNFSNDPTALFVGGLVPRKGLLKLVEVAKKVVKQQANTRFVIVGDGPLRGQLDQSLKAAGLTSNFIFLGNLKEDKLIAAYNAADVFVLPSIQEGQGIVLLEAQACSKPVVAFGVGGVNETVQQNQTGFLPKPDDIEGMADKLRELLSDDNLRQKMGIAGLKFVTENYTWELCAQRMLNLYKEALSK